MRLRHRLEGDPVCPRLIAIAIFEAWLPHYSGVEPPEPEDIAVLPRVRGIDDPVEAVEVLLRAENLVRLHHREHPVTDRAGVAVEIEPVRRDAIVRREPRDVARPQIPGEEPAVEETLVLVEGPAQRRNEAAVRIACPVIQTGTSARRAVVAWSVVLVCDVHVGEVRGGLDGRPERR